MRRILLSLPFLLLTLLFALPALAGNWGEIWGTMIWGSVAAVPSLEGVGVWLLVISLLGAAAWRLRRRITPTVLMLVLLPLVPLLMAPHYTDWNVFSNGEVADADDVNENFDILEREIELAKSEVALLRASNSFAQNLYSPAACLIRNSSSSLNGASDPGIGDGFAKIAVTGVNQIGQAQESCTDIVFDKLLTEYCKYNTQPVQRQVVIYDATTGNVQSSACAAQGCNSVSCP